MTDPAWPWDEAIERAIRYYVVAKLKCRVFKDEHNRWGCVVIRPDS